MRSAIWFLAVLILVSLTCGLVAAVSYRVGWRDAKEDSNYVELEVTPWDDPEEGTA